MNDQVEWNSRKYLKSIFLLFTQYYVQFLKREIVILINLVFLHRNTKSLNLIIKSRKRALIAESRRNGDIYIYWHMSKDELL